MVINEVRPYWLSLLIFIGTFSGQVWKKTLFKKWLDSTQNDTLYSVDTSHPNQKSHLCAKFCRIPQSPGKCAPGSTARLTSASQPPLFSSLSSCKTRTSLLGFEKVKPQLPGKEKCVCRLLTLPRTTCASWQWELGFGAQLVPTCTCPPRPTSAHRPPLPSAQHCHHHLKQPDWEAHNYSKPTTIAQGIKHVAPKASSHLLESRMHDAARGWGSRAQPSTWPQEVPLTGKVARGWVPL